MTTSENIHTTRRVVAADNLGLCFGVRRAIATAEAAAAAHDTTVTTLGPLVHNPYVAQRLASAGVHQADTVGQAPAGTLVLSAHGVSPAIRTQALTQGLKVLDSTCPFVTKVHRVVERMVEEGRHVVLLGDTGHTEVLGVLGVVESLGGSVTLVSTPSQAAQLKIAAPIGIVSQTTRRSSEVEELAAILNATNTDVKVVNTVCGATDTLQSAVRKLARSGVDGVVVVGGFTSANSRRLVDICVEEGVPSWLVESPEQVSESWLAGLGCIGVTAGASTPDELVEAVARRIAGGDLPANWRIRHPD